MKDPDQLWEDPRLGTLVRRPSMQLAEGLSRRSLIAKALRVTLFAVGVQTVYAVVSPTPAEATSHCTPCYWCGLCGVPCTVCGGGASTCPAGTSRGSNAWCACCPCGTCTNYCYYDCCGSGSCSQGQCSNNCGPWIAVWCTGNYVCTVAIDSGSCGPC